MEREIWLIKLLYEKKLLRNEQRELLSKLEWKQVLNLEKIEHDMLESGLDNQEGQTVVGYRPTIKEEPGTKEENEAEEEER